jgi:hypothetical protein
MGATTLAIRCPACGQELRAVVTPSPPTQWFPCPHCRTPVPVVVPRDPPPLYSWEVLPNLYPPLPRPRIPSWQAKGVVAFALVGVVILAAVFGAALAYYGVAAAAPGNYPVNGDVDEAVPGGGVMPAAGATVTLTEDGGATMSVTTTPTGYFSFTGAPTGGIVVEVTLPGYAPVTVETFASSVYDAGTTNMYIVLEPASTSNATTVYLSPFSDLESLLASIGSGILLLGLIALVAGVAAMYTLRQNRPALGVIGGGAGLLAPFALYLLALSTPFPLLWAATAALAGLGGFALTVRAVELGQTGPAEGSS